ncbi:MAG TPA: hypothetical protein PK867_26725, partial [Pirellulales bacterium]|nr:hypothetical protein [Pirellulales bacterium]
EPVVGPGIPANTTIVGIDSATNSVSISNSATATADGVSLTFGSSLAASFDLNFSFGLDLTTYLATQAAPQQPGSPLPPMSLAPQFVLNSSQPLTVSADLTASSINVAGHVGFLGASVQNGSVAVYDDLSLTLPSGDLHTNDFATPALGGRLQVSGPGSLTATLPVQAMLGGQTLSGTVNVTDASLFPSGAIPATATAATPTVSISGANAAALSAFENVTAGDIQGALVQLAGWFDDLRTSALDHPIPLTGEKLSDVVDLKQLYNQVMAAAVTNRGQPAFSNVQQLLALLPNVLSGVPLVPSSNPNLPDPELTFQVKATASLPAITTPLSFTTQVGLLSLNSGATSTVAASTPLAQLNGGVGVAGITAGTPNSGNDIVITLHDGEAFSISFQAQGLTATSTLADAVNAIASGTSNKVKVSFDATSQGLVLEDTTYNPANPGTGNFSIAAAKGSQAGDSEVGLGIIGSDSVSPGTISGAALNVAPGQPSLTITPSANFGFTFGVDLNPLGTEGPKPMLSP